jgi:hypothetical protein
MPTAATNNFSLVELQPAIATGLERTIAIGLAPNQNLARGTVLGELASTDAKWTITISASTSGGTFKLTMTSPAAGQTAAITWNATNTTLLANIQAALNAKYGTTGGTPNVLAAAVALTAGIGTISLVGQELYGAQPLTWTLQDSTTGGSGTTIATTTTGVKVTPGQYKAYASGNTDGSQIPKVILMRDCQSDANGLITESATSSQVGGQWGQQYLTTQAYFTGPFQIGELTGLDANAVTVMGGRIVQGNLSDGGIFHF